MGRQAHDCYTLVVTGTGKFFSTLLIEGSVSRNWSSEVVTIVGLPTICKMTDASRFINSYLLRMHSATLICQLEVVSPFGLDDPEQTGNMEGP